MNALLDPTDWKAFRTQAHRMLDEMVDYFEAVREQPTWQPMPQDAKDALDEPMPREGAGIDAVYDEFARTILPYPTGNIHPRFFGWVHGSGTPVGALADLFAATMNSNVGGRDHAAVYVERAVIAWFCKLFGFARGSGILLGGTSMANFAGILVARTAHLGHAVRAGGVGGHRLTGYASTATHACVRKAFEMAGLGSAQLRVIRTDAQHRIDVEALKTAIASDREAGFDPFVVVGNAGTVDVGAIDPLDELAHIAAQERMWFHVDGAFGAMGMLSESLRPGLAGIERASSIAFDFHKWLHVPYDAACLLVSDAELHRETFASEGPYVTRMDRGLAAGTPWFADFGPDLSRSFRALKVWFTIKTLGTRRLAEAIEMNCRQAAQLARLIENDSDFELSAPVRLNVVCFRHHTASSDEVAVRVQEGGRAVVSSTTVAGVRVLRACFTNHRTRDEDVSELFAVLKEATTAPSN